MAPWLCRRLLLGEHFLEFLCYHAPMADEDPQIQLSSFKSGVDFANSPFQVAKDSLVGFTQDSSAGNLTPRTINVIPFPDGGIQEDHGTVELDLTTGGTTGVNPGIPAWNALNVPRFGMPIKSAGGPDNLDAAAFVDADGARLLLLTASFANASFQTVWRVFSATGLSGPGEFGLEVTTDNAGARYLWIARATGGTMQKILVSNINGAAHPAAAAWAGTPPVGHIIRSWKNMMLVSGVSTQPQRLYFSAVNNPESWPANNFIDIKSVDDENDTIVGLYPIEDYLLVFKQRSVWVVTDPVTFDNRRIGSIGCLGPQFISDFEERVYFYSGVGGGIYSTDGDSIVYESKFARSLFGPSDLGSLGKFTDVLMAPSKRVGSECGQLTITSDGRLFLFFGHTDANVYTLVGYLRNRGERGIPWYLLGGTRQPWQFLSGMAELRIPVSQTNRLDPIEGTGNCLMGIVHNTTRLYVTRLSYENAFGDAFVTIGQTSTVSGRMLLPPIVGANDEQFLRLRKLNFRTHGTSSQFIVEVYKNYQVGTIDFTGTAVPTNRFARVRPEMRGRALGVSVKWAGAVGSKWQINTVEALCRAAGR